MFRCDYDSENKKLELTFCFLNKLNFKKNKMKKKNSIGAVRLTVFAVIIAILAGASGGFLVPRLVEILCGGMGVVLQPSEPLEATLNEAISATATATAAANTASVANTYIVFTTLIFVVVTLILTIAGIIFTHQFSLSKSEEFENVINDIADKMQDDDNISYMIVNKLLRKSEVRVYLKSAIDEMLKESLKDRSDYSDHNKNESNIDANKAEKLNTSDPNSLNKNIK